MGDLSIGGNLAWANVLLKTNSSAKIARICLIVRNFFKDNGSGFCQADYCVSGKIFNRREEFLVVLADQVFIVQENLKGRVRLGNIGRSTPNAFQAFLNAPFKPVIE